MRIVRFHAVYWLALLLSAGLPLPTTVFVHDYLTVDGAKLSKSAGNVRTMPVAGSTRARPMVPSRQPEMIQVGTTLDPLRPGGSNRCHHRTYEGVEQAHETIPSHSRSGHRRSGLRDGPSSGP